jgi:hypothetical protein
VDFSTLVLTEKLTYSIITCTQRLVFTTSSSYSQNWKPHPIDVVCLCWSACIMSLGHKSLLSMSPERLVYHEQIDCPVFYQESYFLPKSPIEIRTSIGELALPGPRFVKLYAAECHPEPRLGDS